MLDNREIGLFNIDGTIYALDNTCPHSGAQLTDGWVDAETVTCPWHAWEYDVTTGKLVGNSEVAVASYPSEVRGDEIFVDIG